MARHSASKWSDLEGLEVAANAKGRMKTVVVRADASAVLGGGHVYRCHTLVSELQGRGWSPVFAGAPETQAVLPFLDLASFLPIPVGLNPREQAHFLAEKLDSVSLLIVDHYDLDETFEQACSFAARRLVVDDLANRRHDCDLLVDQTLGRGRREYRSLVPDRCRVLTGSRYALLRPDFRRARAQSLSRRESLSSPPKLLVMCGATDPTNLSGQVVEALAAFPQEVECTLVLSPQAPFYTEVMEDLKVLESQARVKVLPGTDRVAELMVESDIAIGAAGSTSWERCCLGLPCLTVVVAENQDLIGRHLEERKATILLGRAEDVKAEVIRRRLVSLLQNNDLRRELSENSSQLIDGNGAARVADAIEELYT